MIGNIFSQGKSDREGRGVVPLSDNVKAVYPSDGGWLEKKLSKQEIEYVWKCVNRKREGWNFNLAGNIENSYRLNDKNNWFYDNTIKPLIADYENQFPNNPIQDVTFSITGQHTYQLSSWWVNFQNQGDFNPLHKHRGVYSFVIWLKIPTDFKDQCQLPISKKSNSQSISNFEFSFMDIMGAIKTYVYYMSPELEGTMLLFPSRLNHQVYPFYECDEQRISVSGNVFVNTFKTL